MRREPVSAAIGAGLVGTGLVVTGLVVAGCSGSGGTPASTPPRSSLSTSSSTAATMTGSTARSTTSATSATRPSGSLPALPALPSDLAGSDPCAHADSAFTAASVYLGLAQLGRTDEAQRCVRGDGVPTSTTAALVASGVAAFYVPSGSTSGPSIRFVPASGGTAVTVTTAASGGRYGVTAVGR